MLKGHKEKNSNINFEILMKKFPEVLQCMVKNERYNHQINKFTLFKDNFTEKSMKKLINTVEEEYYMPN